MIEPHIVMRMGRLVVIVGAVVLVKRLTVKFCIGGMTNVPGGPT